MRVVRTGSPSRVGLVDGAIMRLLPDRWSPLDALSATSTELDDAVTDSVTWDEEILLSPVPTPASLRDCVGFLDHIRNARSARDVHDPLPAVWGTRPAFYFANPRSLRSSRAEVARPATSVQFDFELEIAAIIGRSGRDLTAADAADHIAGYVLYCDWSARDIQADERAMQIGQGKGKDSAISLGPWILDAKTAGAWRRVDGFAFEVSVHVDDRPVVATPFLGMDWSFEELIAYASLGADLSPGDLVASGTVPWGCLLEHQRQPDFPGWLEPGQTMRMAAGPLGDIVASITESGPEPAWTTTSPAGAHPNGLTARSADLADGPGPRRAASTRRKDAP